MGIDLMEYAAMKNGKEDAVCAFEDPFDCMEKKAEFRLADEMLNGQQRGFVYPDRQPKPIIGSGPKIRQRNRKQDLFDRNDD